MAFQEQFIGYWNPRHYFFCLGYRNRLHSRAIAWEARKAEDVLPGFLAEQQQPAEVGGSQQGWFVLRYRVPCVSKTALGAGQTLSLFFVIFLFCLFVLNFWTGWAGVAPTSRCSKLQKTQFWRDQSFSSRDGAISSESRYKVARLP